MDSSYLDRVIRKVEDFYFGEGSSTGEQLFNSFAKKHSYLFSADMKVTESENRLEHTIAYQEFQQLFESKIDEIVRSEGRPVEDFFKILQERAKEDDDCKVFIQVLLSVSDYESFVEMMVAYCGQNSN